MSVEIKLISYWEQKLFLIFIWICPLLLGGRVDQIVIGWGLSFSALEEGWRRQKRRVSTEERKESKERDLSSSRNQTKKIRNRQPLHPLTAPSTQIELLGAVIEGEKQRNRIKAVSMNQSDQVSKVTTSTTLRRQISE
jgi:hypothetical protein